MYSISGTLKEEVLTNTLQKAVYHCGISEVGL